MPQAAAGDPEQFGRPHLVPPGPLQHPAEQLPLHQGEGLGVQLAGARLQPLRDEPVPVEGRPRVCGGGDGAGRGLGGRAGGGLPQHREEVGQEDAAAHLE